ncbi:exosome complex component RRP4 isoform X2 [Cylas formicarius]|uniref:exosome complex component RRP4 isoform X2 n=1 Tax=Cylas formicarius TaxID=197179 RepID=UPI0029583238|nr:exosome complex component RRP4 isoform X2 [Cylas formicarius]
MSNKIHIRAASDSTRINPFAVNQSYPRIFTPGETVIASSETGILRGQGTYFDEGNLKASVAGVKEQWGKIVSINPLKSRYTGQVGEFLVGRITEVQQKRWKVDTNSRLDSVLLLSSIKLPTGEQRRTSAEDQHMMRQYLQEGDLISAELSQGILVKVFPSLVKKTKVHFYRLSFGVDIILGSNGYIWISPPTDNNTDTNIGGFVQNLEEVVPRDTREAMSRVRNCILALAQSKMMLFSTSIIFAYEESLKYSASELLLPEAMADVAFLTQHRLHLLQDYEFT